MSLSIRERYPKGSNSALALVCGPNGHEGWWIWLNMFENTPRHQGWLCTSLLSGSPTWKDVLVMPAWLRLAYGIPSFPKSYQYLTQLCHKKVQLMPCKGTGYSPSSLLWGVLGPGGGLPHPQSLGCLSIPTYHEHCVGGGWERKEGPS